ncbi:OLC1v1024937C3 [Oldenlandia corymbosa var. corymbosa]|uniref:Annexin n=1 Tax=Oldenlandia corymbosa var. corymbosa TaxID=529605 RepID=A0AAV1C3L8_OLDCO|nr:OLC1v1024937C3 [Oldenlandia corymbosa var. corymbosa]
MATLRVPDDVPTPRVDCERLRRAFQGFGTDENAIIKVLGRRNASQRKKIRETYQQLYNKSLIEDLQSELSGDFRNAVISWTYDPSERDARLANGVLKSRGKGVKELQILVEIACASSPHHLMAVRQAYASLFDHSLEEDITLNVPMPLQKILVNLVRSYRYDKELVDSDVANSEAARLYEVIKTKKLDEDDFILILSTRNVFQLKETFRFYEKNYGNPIDEDIVKCGKGTLESVLKVLIWCINSPEKHFAEVIRASIVGFGTDEDALTRAILARAEIDMMKVREEYLKQNKSSLDSAVIGDTSGDYKDFLMTLLGANA